MVTENMPLSELEVALENIGSLPRERQVEIGMQAAVIVKALVNGSLRLVPSEPSYEMLEAMRGVHGQQDSPKWYERQRRRYRAMLRETLQYFPK